MRASIIIPVYKAEDFIGDCLTSVLEQTVTDFEVICVDDGSPDGSAEVVEGFARRDSRVLLLRKDNGGASSARNMGYEAASGEFVSFVDADDYVSSDFLRVLLDSAETQDADIALGNKYVDHGKRTVARTPILKEGLLTGSGFFKQGILNRSAPHAKLIRRAFLEKHGIRFLEGITYEDYLHWVEVLAQQPRIALSADFVYTYKKNPDSISSPGQLLTEYNIQSRLIQTQESLRVARESTIEGFEERLFRLQFNNRVMRTIKALRIDQNRDEQEQAFSLLKEGLQAFRQPLATRVSGWRRLIYKVILDGELDDLKKVLNFTQGKISLKTKFIRKDGHSRLYIDPSDLPSIQSAKKWFFDISDLVEDRN